MIQSKRMGALGFSAVEGVLVVLVIAVIAVAGFFVVNRKHQVNSAANADNAGTSHPAAVPLDGTTASVSELTQQEAQSETNADGSADTQAQQAATSANGAVDNVGGSYNENSL